MKHTRAAAILLLALVASLGILVSVGATQAQELEWSFAERDELTLWHSQGQLRADDLADHAQGAYDLVSDLIDVDVSAPLAIIVWPQGGDPTNTASFPPGIEDYADVRHVLRNSSGDVRSTVTNALIDAATGAHAEQVPFWMRAALGFWSAGPLPGFYLRRAGSVVLFDHEEFYSLEQLETVPTTWQFQAKYFGQAGGMLAWFIQDWGPDTLAELFQTVGDGVPFYGAIEQVFDIPEDRLIAEFTKDAERALLLNWPYIEPQKKPFYETLNLNYVILVAAAIPLSILFFFIGKRLFYD